jgi:hypothetical protein
MVSHGPQPRMGRYVHISALAPLRTAPMCVIARISEVPQDGRRSRDPQDPYLIGPGLCVLPKTPLTRSSVVEVRIRRVRGSSGANFVL